VCSGANLGLRHSSKCWPQPTGQWPGVREPDVSRVPPDRWGVGRLTLTGTRTTPSLSSAYKKEEAGRSFPFCRLFPSTPRWGHTSACRHLAAGWLHHWVIPRVSLFYTSLHFFYPRFRHHRHTPPSATTDHVGDLRLPQVRSFPIVSHCQQGPPPCSFPLVESWGLITWKLAWGAP
jgi:hypothetical protein